MKPIKFIAVFTLSILLSSCALFKGAKSADPIILNYSVPEGQEFVMTSSGSNEINQETNGQSILVITESASKMECVSQGNTADGLNKMQIQYAELSQSVSSPMGDSDTDFSGLLNKKISIDVGPKGDCSNFSGLDDMDPITTATGEQIDATVFKDGIEQMFFKLPAEPVKVGSTWNQEITSETPYSGGTLKTTGNIEYEVTEIKKIDNLPCVIIVSEGTIKTSGNFQQQGMDLELTRTAKTTGTTAFAYTKGMFISTESISTTTGSVEVLAMNMSIPQDIKGQSTSRVVFK